MKKFNPTLLPYAYDSLEPYIDRETMFVHYNKHYLGYLNNLNDEISVLQTRQIPIRKLIETIDSYSNSIRNNAGGYYNHSLFWLMLQPNDGTDNIPSDIVRKVIERDFGTTLEFRNLVEKSAKNRFGSGWVWWIMMPDGTTRIISTPYQDNPQMYFDCEILLGIDVWEHAYYLKYKSDRMKYVDNIFKVINWSYPEKILNQYGERMFRVR